jgi:N-acetylmuramoyl-L-alanine amidase
VSLEERSRLADQKNVDVFVSIHANSSPEEKARGVEIYFENQTATDEESLLTAKLENSVEKKKPEEESKQKSDVDHILSDLGHSRHMEWSSLLCQSFVESFKAVLNIKTQAIRQAPFRVLMVTMPASLIEVGFLSNAKDAAWLKTPQASPKIAQAIHTGLISYKEKLDKINSKPVD